MPAAIPLTVVLPLMQLFQRQAIHMEIQQGLLARDMDRVQIIRHKCHTSAGADRIAADLLHPALLGAAIKAIQFVAADTNNNSPGGVIVRRRIPLRVGRINIQGKTMIGILADPVQTGVAWLVRPGRRKILLRK